MDLPEPPPESQARKRTGRWESVTPGSGRPPVPRRPDKKPGLSKGVWALIIFGGLIAIVAISQANDDDSTRSSIGVDDSSTTHTLTYRVDGDSNQADITYENSSGDTSQETGAALPWTETFTVEEGSFAYVSAQRGGAPGDITCTIELDGVEVESNTSTGEFSICTASGTI